MFQFWPGLYPIKLNLSFEKFSYKNLIILNPPISRHNILLQLAGQISGNFPLKILIGTQFGNLWKFSEIWEFCQNSENFLLIGLSPGLENIFKYNKIEVQSYQNYFRSKIQRGIKLEEFQSSLQNIIFILFDSFSYSGAF